MIKHVVCYQLHERTKEKAEEVKAKFMSMEGEIDVIKKLQVGIDFLRSERSYDVILEITFESVEDMNAYQKHPYHLEVIKPFMAQTKKLSVSVDYEF